MAKSPLEVHPQDVRDYLLTHAYFDDINVYFLREEQIQSKIDNALTGLAAKAGKSGAAVCVLMPLFDVVQPDVPGPQLEPSLTVRCQEIPTINLGANGTQKSAEQIAQQVSQILDGWFANLYYSTMRPAKEHITPTRDYLPKLTYDVKWISEIQLNELKRVEMPVIAPAGGIAGITLVTITCGTVGATIYYTLDETLPTPTNGTAYAAPFVPPGGTTMIRAAAYLANSRGSCVNAAEFT